MTGQPAPEPDAGDIADYLRALYGSDGGDAPGWLTVFALPSQRTTWVRGDELFGDTPDRIAALGASENVYIGVGLRAEQLARGRGRDEDVMAIPGLWLDLDIKGANHVSEHLPRSRAEALDFLASDVDLRPSLVVDSGGGLQVYWLFHELAVFANEIERNAAADLSERFQRTILRLGAERGWKLDNTADLARILRPAGELNHKSTPAQRVRTLWRSDARFTSAEFESFIAANGEPAKTPVAQPARPLRHRNSRPMSLRRLVDHIDWRIRRFIAEVGTCDEGQRDNAAVAIALLIVNDLAVDDDIALAYLCEWDSQNRPPLGDAYLRQKIANAHRYAKRPRGCGLEPNRGSAA